MYLYTIPTPLGDITLAEEEAQLVQLCLPGLPLPPGQYEGTPLLQRAAAQLKEYLAGARRTFDLPLQPRGTPFQQKVWQALQQIPYGHTMSYGQLAARIGRPKASRAVGMACHCNPLPILIPCHRVLGASGSLTGYAGGLGQKRFLLALEAKNRDC